MLGEVQYSGLLVYNIDKCGGGGTVQWILGLQHRQMWGVVQYSGFFVYNRQMWGGVQYSGFLVYNIDKCWEGTVQYSGFLVYNIDTCGEGYSIVDSWFTT